MKHTKPNIVLVNCDDLGYGDLGCYGSQKNNTPVLDQLASEGVRFTNFYMASPVCSPSRGAMMTGCYPSRIGFGNFDGSWVLFPGQGLGLHENEITVADQLKKQGYATMIIGKWHCGDQPEFLPTRHGFDQYFGIPYSNDMGRQAGRTKQHPPLPLLEDETVIQEQPDQAGLTERYVEHAVRFIRQNKETPFFLYLAHMHVHLPIYAPESFLKRSKNGPYGAAVECIDWAMGAIWHELKEQGLEENTLIVFTSDNGSRGDHGGSNDPLRGAKGTTWEGGMRVPCIAYWKGQIFEGRVYDDVVTAMDFFPTFSELAGSDVPTDRTIDGKDIRPILFDKSPPPSPYEAFFYYSRNRLEAVRVGPWKLHLWKKTDQIKELYNLVEDPSEQHNRYAEHPDIVQKMMVYVNKAQADLGDEAENIMGSGCRPVGRVANPDSLTHYDPSHPYIIAMYDLEDAG
jgi:arylsulfatase A